MTLVATTSSAPQQLTVRRAKRRQLWFFLVPLILVFALGTYLRWHALGAESLWFDEGMTAWLIHVPLSEMAAFMRQDASFPLLFVLLKGWVKLFGESEAAMRSLSALAATLSMLVLARLAWGLTKSQLATIAAVVIFAVSPLQIEYAKDARYYALLCFFLLSALECVRWHVERETTWPAVFFALFAAAALYTHQIAAFYLAAIDVLWLVLPSSQPMRIRVRNCVLANMGVVVLYGPWLPIALQQVHWTATHFWAQPPDGNEFLRTLSALVGGKPYELKEWFVALGQAWAHEVPAHRFNSELANLLVACTPEQVAGIVVVIGAFALGAALLVEKQARNVVALLIAAFAPVLLIYLYSLLGRPAFMERVFIGSTPFIALVIAIPMASRAGRWLALPLVLAMICVNAASTYAFTNLAHKEDWRGAEQYVANLPRDQRRAIVFVANEGQLVFDYYARRSGAKPNWSLETGAPGGFFDLDPPQVLRQVKSSSDLASLAQQLASQPFDEVIVVRSHLWWADPDDLVSNLLYDHFDEIGQRDFNGVEVARWQRRDGASIGSTVRKFAAPFLSRGH